jgi:hypothetical protein
VLFDFWKKFAWAKKRRFLRNETASLLKPVLALLVIQCGSRIECRPIPVRKNSLGHRSVLKFGAQIVLGRLRFRLSFKAFSVWKINLPYDDIHETGAATAYAAPETRSGNPEANASARDPAFP